MSEESKPITDEDLARVRAEMSEPDEIKAHAEGNLKHLIQGWQDIIKKKDKKIKKLERRLEFTEELFQTARRQLTWGYIKQELQEQFERYEDDE